LPGEANTDHRNQNITRHVTGYANP